MNEEPELDDEELESIAFLQAFAAQPYDPLLAVYDGGFITHTVRSWRQGLTDCREPFYDRMDGLNLYTPADDDHITMSPVGLPDVLYTLCGACVRSYLEEDNAA